MKRSNIRAFILGVLVTVIVMSTAAPAVASTMKAAQLYYNNIKIRLNGEELVPKDATGKVVEPFAIDGTTYLPIRAISSALGLNVSWDGATQTVVLGNDPEYNQPAKWLGEMTPFMGDINEYMYDEDEKDAFTSNEGDKFSRYIVTNPDVTYHLDGEYTRFTGTFYLNKANYNTNTISRRYTVYVDGVMAYQTEPIMVGHTPESFEIDVTGATELKIVTEARNHTLTDFGPWRFEGTYGSGVLLGNAALWND